MTKVVAQLPAAIPPAPQEALIVTIVVGPAPAHCHGIWREDLGGVLVPGHPAGYPTLYLQRSPGWWHG